MHGLSKEELENVEQEETKNVDEAVKFAVRSSEPSLEEAFTDVFTTWEA
jgi:TPP-dependent pyruvate/acetoin dehydrogenase alpha subunit